MFAAMKEGLARHRIMGINARNRDFILPHNRRRHFPLVDNKLLTKQLAIEAGIPVPELYGVIEFIHDAGRVAEIASPHRQFAVKPCRGSGGGGIMVIKNVINGSFQKASGEILPAADMQYHVTNMLSGMYSLKGAVDKVIVEYAVKFDPIFDEITYQGVPDIRIIVYKGIPVMAMLRLPTRKSDGKANLHKGGIGVGIRMHDGVTMYGVQGNRFIDEHPETLCKVSGRKIPDWPKLLEMASKFYDITGLGYVGVDIVLDRDKGPMVLEANARPGIAIQIANRRGLLSRTEKVDVAEISTFSMSDRIAFALTAFKSEAGNELPFGV
jgi:alpha-L-glutamate ligase-like protein